MEEENPNKIDDEEGDGENGGLKLEKGEEQSGK